MVIEMWMVSGLVLVTLGLLASNRFPADAVLVFVLAFILVAGILTPTEALVGFSDKGMVTIAVLYAVVAGLRETGAVDWLSRVLLGKPKSPTEALIRLVFPAMTMSAFINNSPIVAMFTVAIQDWCKRSGFKASRFLMPLSFAAILGGTCTLIGTSTNLVVDGLMQKAHLRGLGLFELGYVGLPVAVIGCLYLVTIGQKLLPDRTGSIEQFDDVREYLLEMQVEEGCELAGQSVEQAGLRHLPGLYLIEIVRNDQVFSVVSPDTLILAGDHLVFAGAVESVVELRRIRGLVTATRQAFKLDSKLHERRLFEAVISAESPIANSNLREARFRHRYNAVVLAVSRNGQRIKGKLGDITLHPGDTLLIEAEKGFLFKYRNSRDFLLISKLENSTLVRHERAPLALSIMVVMLALTVFDVLPILQASILAAVTMIVTGCLTFEGAQKDIDFNVLMVIACAFALGASVEKVGLANIIAQQALSVAANDPWLLLVIVYITTVLVTEVITNNAAAILMFPIALSSAHALNVSELPFSVAIMIAASASFMTPIGYQTNLMVYGPGGYHFGDYIRLGLPLTLLEGITALWLIPIIWPF
ncbi:MAG: SLC13 family permease [Methylovulum sp.]|nr:SLC13 family permease [Methylovulum sp.]